jgi:hypothetical protein
MFLVIGYPIYYTVYLSFYSTPPSLAMADKIFVGLENYERILSSNSFREVTINTAIWTIFSTFFAFVMGLGAALVLNREFHGRALIRGILESARGVASNDTSERARAARTIRGYGDLNGMEFVARIGVEKDKSNPRDEGRNVIAAAIGPDHADYDRPMGGAPAAARATTPGQAAQATTGGAAPPWAAAQPSQPSAGAAGDAPFWAR